jgi:hypothetical protein
MKGHGRPAGGLCIKSELKCPKNENIVSRSKKNGLSPDYVRVNSQLYVVGKGCGG